MINGTEFLLLKINGNSRINFSEGLNLRPFRWQTPYEYRKKRRWKSTDFHTIKLNRMGS